MIAFGSVYLLPSVLRQERTLRALAPLGNAIGDLLFRWTQNRNWAELAYIGTDTFTYRLGSPPHGNGPRRVFPRNR